MHKSLIWTGYSFEGGFWFGFVVLELTFWDLFPPRLSKPFQCKPLPLSSHQLAF